MSFTWATSRAARCLDRIIPAEFSGTVQCDGYVAYHSFANRSEGRITLAACGPMRGASSAKPQRAHRNKEDGCFCRSSISTASKNNCARPKPDRSKGKPCEPARAA